MANDDKKNDGNEPIIRKKKDEAPGETPETTEQPEAAPEAQEPQAAGGGFGPNADPVEIPPKAASEEGRTMGRRVVDMTKPQAPSQPADGGGEPARAVDLAPPVDNDQGARDLPGLQDRHEEKDQAKSQAKPKDEQQGESMQIEQGSRDDFAAMLAEADSVPEARRYNVGERVSGRIIQIDSKFIHVELDRATEGVAYRHDFTDKEGNVTLQSGETADFYVVGFGGGSVQLGDQLSTKDAALDALLTAADTGAPVQGRVVSKNKGGFEVEIGGVMTFCPISQIELAFTEDPDVHLNQTYRFRVQEVREGGRSIVVSRSALLEEEMAAKRAETMANLKQGDVVSGVVTRTAPFGVFVDIGGVEGLVHISELGFSHVDHPDEVVKQGESIDVEVLDIDDSGDRLRIGLSRKATLQDPWVTAAETLHEGAKITGEVVRIETFGAFVQVAEGVEGLIHVSELSWEHVKRPEDVVSVGDKVTVEVLSVDPHRRRLGLSMKGAKGDPWSEIGDRFPVGSEVTGTVANVEDFGAFIDLEGGITGLVPRSEMELGRGGTVHSRFHKGHEVTVRVLAVDRSRRRMTLTEKSAEEIADAADAAGAPRSYDETARGGEGEGGESGGFGTLGDLLKSKLKKD